jgi:hypothetical protein
MPQTLETFQLNMLQPIQNPEDARPDAMKFAASLTITKGQAVSVTTATGLGSPLVPGASDGTQLFVGFRCLRLHHRRQRQGVLQR